MPKDDISSKVAKYIDYIRNDKKIEHALCRLEELPMTVDVLSGTGVGRVVNRLRDNDEFGEQATALVEKWKNIAKQSGILSRKEKRRENSQNSQHNQQREDSQLTVHQVKRELATPSPDQDSEPEMPSESTPPPTPPATPPLPPKVIRIKKLEIKHDPPSSAPLKTKAPSTDYNDNNDGRPKEKRAKIIKIKNATSDSAFGSLLSAADTESSKSKKHKKSKKAKPLDWAAYQPELDPSYRPLSLQQQQSLPQPGIVRINQQKEERKSDSDDDMANFNEEKMFKPRKDRIRVFAGRRKVGSEAVGQRQIATLFNMCIKVLVNNIGAIEETGDIPYEILKPILSKCTPQQLAHIEKINPYLEEDSDELWQVFVGKQFKEHNSNNHEETWKEAYYRCKKEEENRFKRLTKKISKNISKSKESEQGPKMALFADAKAPREVRRRQAKFGTSQLASQPLPSAAEISKARQKIFEEGSSSSLQALPPVVVARHSQLGSRKGNGGSKKPVRGALMQKTLKMLNVKRRR